MDPVPTSDPSSDPDGEPPDPSAALNRLRNLPRRVAPADLVRIVRDEERARHDPSPARAYWPPTKWDKLSMGLWASGGAFAIVRGFVTYPTLRDGLVATVHYVAAHPPIVSALYNLLR